MEVVRVTTQASVRQAATRTGVAGLSVWRGQVREEEEQQLKSLKVRLKVYREMARDAVIATLLEAVKSPLLAAEFDVTAAGDLPVDQEAKDFAYSALMEDLGQQVAVGPAVGLDHRAR